MSTKARTTFANRFLISKLRYGMPLYIGETQAIKHKLHIQIMTIARFCRGNYGFKVSCHKICKSLKWDVPEQTLLKSAALYIHKCTFYGKPKQINNLLRTTRMRRNNNIYIKYMYETGKFERNMLIQACKLYNSLPEDLKSLLPKLFKTRIKKLYIEGHKD